jgi:hypothetical protein
MVESLEELPAPSLPATMVKSPDKEDTLIQKSKNQE